MKLAMKPDKRAALAQLPNPDCRCWFLELYCWRLSRRSENIRCGGRLSPKASRTSLERARQVKNVLQTLDL